MAPEKPDDEDPTPEERTRMPVGRPHGRKEWEPILIKFLPEQRRRVEAAARLVAKQMSPFIRDATMASVKEVEEQARADRRQEMEEQAFRRRLRQEVPTWAKFADSPGKSSPQHTTTPESPSLSEQLAAHVMAAPEAERAERAEAALKIVEGVNPSEAARLRTVLGREFVGTKSEPWWRALVPKP